MNSIEAPIAVASSSATGRDVALSENSSSTGEATPARQIVATMSHLGTHDAMASTTLHSTQKRSKPSFEIGTRRLPRDVGLERDLTGHESSLLRSTAIGRQQGTSSAPKGSALAAALAAMHQVLREPPSLELWQDSARKLRAATAQERNRSRRHAALALLLADVLSFTGPDDLDHQGRARDALELGWRVLSEPFVSTDAERRVTTELVRTGWQLTLPYRGWVSRTR
jgi:hypothetical protein